MGWPCVDEARRYVGCVGLAQCAAAGTVRCWSGHYLSVARGEHILVEVQPDYTPSQCTTCANAVDAQVARKTKSTADGRLVTCSAGLWTGLVSVYNLINHRVPVKAEARPPCPSYVELAPAEYRDELKAKRAYEAERQRAKRRELRADRQAGTAA